MATKDCKIEFYFRRGQLEKLLADNPTAKGIIISQEVIQRTQPNGKSYNMLSITARVDKKAKKKVAKKGGKAGGGTDEGVVDGCPYPPGCTE